MNLVMNKNSMILLFKQGKMQAKHEIYLKYKGYNLYWWNREAMPFQPFLILSNGTFYKINIFVNTTFYKFLLNNLLKTFNDVSFISFH
jgi:hypothetical protein